MDYKTWWHRIAAITSLLINLLKIHFYFKTLLARLNRTQLLCSRVYQGLFIDLPSIPYISISTLERFGNEFGTLSMVSLWTCIQCIDNPGPVYSFLWQIWHLKCLAFWCWIRIFSSSNSLLQYLNLDKEVYSINNQMTS